MTPSLIQVAELAEQFAGPMDTVVLDVRYNLGGPPGREGYDEGHLQGAYFLDLDTVLAGEPGRQGRHPLPELRTVEIGLGEFGIASTTPIVVYDEANSLAAARAWWILRYFDLTDVRVLDGGLAAWRAAGGPVTAEVPLPAPNSVPLTPGGMPLLDADGAAALAADPDAVLLDSRAPQRFRGEVEPIDPVAGHIPGAVNAPMNEYLTGDGRFLAPGELRKYFESKGVRPGVTVGTSCGSGVTAAHTALALDQIGVPAMVYVGSWSNWIALERPVATGN